MTLLRSWPKLRIAHRLGIAIILTILATFVFDQALRYVLPPPPFLIVQREWLVDAVGNAAERASKGEVLTRGDDLLAYTVMADPPERKGASALTGRLQRDLMDALDLPAQDVVVSGTIFDQNRIEQTVRPATVIVADLPTMLTAEITRSAQSIVLSDLVLAIRLQSSSWLVITPVAPPDSRRHYLRVILGFGGSLLFIVLFSAWIARSVAQPLTRLVNAAEHLGRSREPTIITGMKIPEYAAIADSFNEMQFRLKRFLDERVQMLAAISHDLRTPLTRLRLLAEYLPDQGQRTQLLRSISDIEAMVSEALAFMSEEVHREPFVPVDLASLLISITDEFEDGGHLVEYTGPDHATAMLRPNAIKRALVNLIENGCKYGGQVWIGLRCHDDFFEINIADAGPGIADRDIHRAFEPFERLETSRSRETGGTGLGLTIARDVVQQHGGSIEALRMRGRFTMRVSFPKRLPIN